MIKPSRKEEASEESHGRTYSGVGSFSQLFQLLERTGVSLIHFNLGFLSIKILHTDVTR